MRRLFWDDMCGSEEFVGRWIAMDRVRYDPTTSRPIEADIVDIDDDLAELCTRVRMSDRSSCSILQCLPHPHQIRDEDSDAFSILHH